MITFVSELVDRGSAARARNVRTLLVQVLDQAVTLGLTTDNVARKVRPPLGLARQDLDLDAGVVVLRRGATYADGVGMMLGPTKTQRTAGRQLLAPTVVEHLDLVFTTPTGRPVLRQHVDRAIRSAAVQAGLDPSGLGTHAGRRSVVTNLYASGSLDIADVAQFVGHSDVSTTRGYVQHQGERPRQVSEKAFLLLDPRPPQDADGDHD